MYAGAVVGINTPTILSFSSTSSAVNSGQVVSYSWSIADGAGYTYMIPCVQGIKVKNTDGTAITCNTRYGISFPSNSTSAGLDLIVTNVSGSARNLVVRIIAKDSTGADTSVQQDVSVAVSPATNVLDSITGAVTTESNTSYTLSWSSTVLDNTNVTISCVPEIHVTSPSYANGDIPCGTPIFTTDLGGSGSVTFNFSNSDITARDLKITVLPAMAPGVYDTTNSKSITVSVNTAIAANPAVTSFATNVTGERVQSTTPIVFSWTTKKSSGVNFIFSCNEDIDTLIATSTVPFLAKCGTTSFPSALSSSGNTTIIFNNKSSYVNEPITIKLIPANSDGTYNTAYGKDIALLIIPKTATTVSISTPSTMIAMGGTGATTTVATAITDPGCYGGYRYSTTTGKPCAVSATGVTAPTKVTFSSYLSRGSNNAEVKALQELLAKDSTLYPEGSVIGSFGPATERAVKRFQTKYNIAATGTVGPKTRALLNSLSK